MSGKKYGECKAGGCVTVGSEKSTNAELVSIQPLGQNVCVIEARFNPDDGKPENELPILSQQISIEATEAQIAAMEVELARQILFLADAKLST